MFELPAPKDLLPEKAPIITLAAKVLPAMHHSETNPDARARMALWKAYQEIARTNLAQLIAPVIEEAITLHETMEGDREDADDAAAWDAALDDSVHTQLQQVADKNPEGFAKFAMGVGLHEIGRAHEVADTLAGFVVRTEPYERPLTDHGKALSAVGIVKADITNIAKLVEAVAPVANAAPVLVPSDAAPAVVAPTPLDVAPPVMNAAVGVVVVPASVEGVTPAVGIKPPPNEAEIRQAYSLMYQASGPDAAEMAKRLGCSRGTFINWCTGKNTPKCTTEHAAILKAHCLRAVADMTTALDIFERVR